MTNMAQCPACGVPVDSKDGVCPSCGLHVPGATASFAPVELAETVVPVASATEGPVLVVRKGPQPGERFFLDRPKLSIGRDPESDIFLNDMTVSRIHAVLECSANGVSVTDSGSLNGTYLNGEVVDSARLADGDLLQVGTFQMVFFLGSGVCS